MTQIKFSTFDENVLLSCSSDRTVKLWDIRSNKSIKSEKTKEGCKNIGFNYDSSMFAISHKDENTLSIYDFRKFSAIKQINFKNKINEFEFERTNTFLIVTSIIGNIHLLDTNVLSEESIITIDAHNSPNNSVNCININKSNENFVTGGSDGLIFLWDLEEMISYKVIKKGVSPIKNAVYSNDSKYIAAIYEGPNLDIFDCNTGDNVFTVLTETQQYDVAWNPSKYLIAYSSDDKNRSNVEEGTIHIIGLPSA